MIHCQFTPPSSCDPIIKQFQSTLESSHQDNNIINKHGAVLGLCAFINAFPHTVPSIIPPLLLYLGKHLHDKQPVPATIKKTVQNWRRTHTDNWSQHSTAFTEDQLTQLTDLLVSPSYYA